MNNFTPEDLLLYLYKEASPAQTLAIEKALETSWPLREKLMVIKTAMERLDSITEIPRIEPILTVLKYAQSVTAVHSS